MEEEQEVTMTGRDFVRPLIILGGFVAILWGIEIVDWVTGDFLPLDSWAIRPWRVEGLSGIFFAPFLHGSFTHLAGNSIPLIVLGTLVMWRSQREFWLSSVIIILISGFGTWLTGRPNSIHLGASGLIFGYLGYVLWLGWLVRSRRAIMRAILVIMLYGGFLVGVLPVQDGISWQGHLFGLLGGVFSAYLLAERYHLTTADARPFSARPIEDEIRIIGDENFYE